MQTLKQFLPYAILFAVSIFLIDRLFPTVHPYGGMSLSLTADSILVRSEKILRDMGINQTGMERRIQLKGNHDLLNNVQERFGLERSNRLFRDSVPGYYWEVRWRTQEPHSMTFSSGSSDAKTSQSIVDLLKGDIYFEFDERGNLLQFQHKIPDSADIASVTMAEARTIASAFISNCTSVTPWIGDTSGATARTIEMPHRTDHELVWRASNDLLGNPVKVTVTVAGNQLSKFSIDEEFPKPPPGMSAGQVYSIVLIVAFIVLGIAMLVVAFRRFRSYEIGFRLAIIAGIMAGVLYDVTSYLELRTEAGWIVLVSLILVPVFVGGTLLLVWAVSESVVRETWKDKFITLDLLAKGHILHSRVGRSALYGIAGGFGALALWLVLVYAGDRSMHLWISHSEDSSYRSFELASPVAYILAHSFNLVIFNFAGCVLFVVSFLRKYFRSPWLLITVSALVMGLLNAGHLLPLSAGILIQTAVSAVSIWLYYRFDALASLVSLFVYAAIQETAGLLTAGNASFVSSGYVMIWILGIVVIVALVTLYRRNEITDFEDIAPVFARHITERQHLQQELEIARSVQMSFLPKTNPVTSRLDIASRCAPALEVGGDYYDFIDLGEERLGVAIGDVSGKGTQAAFFMTLMKGFLNALAHVSISPSRVLEQVNRLFYENVERGVFISMVYGIFDTRKNTLSLARAGHNPVIMRKSKAQDLQVVNPKGLALGLDEGDTFAKSIEEVSIKVQRGDLFVFHTDGFTEAMNKTLEEFGEDRLYKTVEKYSQGSSAEIMEGIFRDMKEFTGKAKQHDDMTIVVVKVL